MVLFLQTRKFGHDAVACSPVMPCDDTRCHAFRVSISCLAYGLMVGFLSRSNLPTHNSILFSSSPAVLFCSRTTQDGLLPLLPSLRVRSGDREQVSTCRQQWTRWLQVPSPFVGCCSKRRGYAARRRRHIYKSSVALDVRSVGCSLLGQGNG